MATLGLLSPEFPSSSLDENLRAMSATGAIGVQFDLVSAVGTTFPDTLADCDVQAIKEGFERHGLELSALSGTYNMIDPDLSARQAGAKALDSVIVLAPRLGTKLVTLCTGSRDPHDMWKQHPDSNSPEAWRDLLVTVEQAVRTAELHGVVLAVEPEVSNTVNTVYKARKLLDQIASPILKIVMDGANIFQKGELPLMRSIIDEAFELLGADIALAHAKDLDRDGEAGDVPAGLGKLDYPYYLEKLRDSGYDGSIILHALEPEQALDRLDFVRRSAPVGYLTGRVARA
jgi:sugar phosphate isomerase/epimerase